MKNLQKIGVQELGTQEMRTSNGGHVPSSFYLDDDTIAQNEKILKAVGEAVVDAYDWLKGFADGFIG